MQNILSMLNNRFSPSIKQSNAMGANIYLDMVKPFVVLSAYYDLLDEQTKHYAVPNNLNDELLVAGNSQDVISRTLVKNIRSPYCCIMPFFDITKWEVHSVEQASKTFDEIEFFTVEPDYFPAGISATNVLVFNGQFWIALLSDGSYYTYAGQYSESGTFIQCAKLISSQLEYEVVAALRPEGWCPAMDDERKEREQEEDLKLPAKNVEVLIILFTQFREAFAALDNYWTDLRCDDLLPGDEFSNSCPFHRSFDEITAGAYTWASKCITDLRNGKY